MKMKKYLLFIVEGKNDKTEIQAILRALGSQKFSENYVDIYHTHGGDVTTEKDTTEKTIIKKVTKIIVSWRQGKEYPFQKIAVSDVKKIIHVIDTDGVFIPEGSIIQSDDEKMQYRENTIWYRDRNHVIGRNRKKARVINKLLETKRIDNIPYELFFVSCNMDHLLFDERNLSPEEKTSRAMGFVKQCNDDKRFLLDSVFIPDLCMSDSYSESWKMIQMDYNSLCRHTNLNILLEDVLE